MPPVRRIRPACPTPFLPRRILMTADTVGGVWTYALTLCRALSTRGIEVVLAAVGAPATPDQQTGARSIPTVTFHERPGRLEWMENPWSDVDATGTWLLHLRDRYRPDLIHLNDYSHGALDWGVPVVVVGHSCVLSWWQAVKGEPAPSSWNVYRERVTRGLRQATCVVAPSEAMLAELRRYYGPFSREKTIWNGGAPAAAPAGTKDNIILTAARLWDEAKNAAALAAAAPDLPWPVLVAGEDRHPGGGRANLPGVTPLGRLAPETMIGWFRRAAIYALPARYEPFGLSVLEAAHARCALVLGDISTLRELWDGAARFVHPDDSAGLAATLAGLIDDSNDCRRLGEAARERAGRFSITRMLDRYLALYASLCEFREVSQAPTVASRLDAKGPPCGS